MVHERLESLDQSLSLLERWRRERSGGAFRDALDQAVVELSGQVQDFPEAELRQFAAAGHRGRLEITGGAWSAVVSVQPGGSFVIDDASGPPDEAFPDEATIEEVHAAKDEGRASDLIRLSADLECRAELTLLNNATQSGFHWVRTTEAFLEHAKRRTWAGLVASMFGADSPHRLIVHDGGHHQRLGSDFLLHGPGVFPADQTRDRSRASREYAETWLHDERTGLPTPASVFPLSGEGLEKLVAFFAGVAHGLSWLWLASSTRLTGTFVVIHFEGAPDLDFDLTDVPDATRAAEAVRLWEWAVATTDPARYEAVQQSIALVLREPPMLERSAERVLRTAKYLLRLARQGTIAEALAIRRAARQAAIDAGQSTAEASRSATRSVVDRVATQLIGAFGVLLANQANLINETVAGWLLLGLLGLTVATAIVAFGIEFPSAQGALKAFEQDLEDYSDMLIEEDIGHIKSMKSLASARSQLARAMWVSGILLVAAAVALVVARLVT